MRMLPTHKFITICGLKVDIVQMPDVIEFIENCIKERGSAAYIVTTNANTVVCAKNNLQVRAAVNNADLSIADGYSLVFLSKFYGAALKNRAYGPDLMLEFMRVSEKKGYSNFFYGSTNKTLARLSENLKNSFPRIKIAGYYSPPFGVSSEPDEEGLRIINNSHPDVLWVGLGGVKQECWMHQNKEKVQVPVMVGVGAAFDFLAKIKRQAPRWVREHGFEWFFRLLTEPKRLWRRYLINNLLFIYYVGGELFARIFVPRRIETNK